MLPSTPVIVRVHALVNFLSTTGFHNFGDHNHTYGIDHYDAAALQLWTFVEIHKW
jgi:hypothetical protein